MGTLIDFRGWLRLDLNDPAGASQRFADADLDRAVARAVAELSLVAPRATDTEHVVTSSSRVLDLSGAPYAGLVDVLEVEQPYGAGGSLATFPPSLVPFRLSADRTRLLLLGRTVPAVGDVVRVRWVAAHTITVASTTVPAEHDALVALGAYGYACLAYSTPAADNFRYQDGMAASLVDDTAIPGEWRRRSEVALGQFRAELERLRQQRARSGRPWVTWSQPVGSLLWPVDNLSGGREP